jgi:kynurenine aminotransferase
VVLIEPHFDSYSVVVEVCGGKPVFVPLRPGDNPSDGNNWSLDKGEFEAAFSEKTKICMVNTPHNPIGK